MTVGALALLGVGVAVEPWPAIDATGWAIIVWLAVVNTALAFTLWNVALGRLGAAQISGLQNTMLVQITILAWIFLDEPPGTLGLVGVVVVSIGVRALQRTVAPVPEASERAETAPERRFSRRPRRSR